MAEPEEVNPTSDPTPAWQAIMLLRAARSGTLATARDGQPFASLVTPSTAPDRSVLMLLSGLAEHTRHLKADPRCALMVSGPATSANPQTAPRLTITGTAERVEDAALKERWLAMHPYAALYADFGDFALWRLEIGAAMLVGGFARAHRLRAAALAAPADSVAAIEAAAEDIMGHCNRDHPATLAGIARAPGDWRMVGVDIDGCDLGNGEAVQRVHWRAPVANAENVRLELMHFAHAARAQMHS